MITKEMTEKLFALRDKLYQEEKANRKDITYEQSLSFFAKDVERACKKMLAPGIIVDAKMDYLGDSMLIDFIEGDDVIFHFKQNAISDYMLHCIAPVVLAMIAIENFKRYILGRYFVVGGEG